MSITVTTGDVGGSRRLSFSKHSDRRPMSWHESHELDEYYECGGGFKPVEMPHKVDKYVTPTAEDKEKQEKERRRREKAKKEKKKRRGKQYSSSSRSDSD